MLPSNTVCSQPDEEEEKKPVIVNNVVVSPLNSIPRSGIRTSPATNLFTREQVLANSSAPADNALSQRYNRNEASGSETETSRLAAQPGAFAGYVSVPDYMELSTSANKPLRVYGKWSREEQRQLVQLWCDHHMKASRTDAPKWKEIAARISVKRKITGTQCQRKMKYLRDLYKEAKTYNDEHPNQPLEDRKTSPYYLEIDSVLGCRHPANSSHGEEASAGCNSVPAAAEIDPTASIASVPTLVPPRVYVGEPREDSTSFSIPARLAYWSTIERNSETTDDSEEHRATVNNSAEIDIRRKRRKKNQDSRHSSDDKEAAVFCETMEKLQAQGDRIAAAMEAMLKTQNQQFELMNKFMNTFLQHMQRQTSEDD